MTDTPNTTSSKLFHQDARRRSIRMAILAICAVVVFAIAYIGIITSINQLGGTHHLSALNEQGTIPDEPFYALLIGSDSRKGTALYTGKSDEHGQTEAHSDIMTLVRVDAQNHIVTLITIPRDTVLPGETDKINQTLATGGPTATVAAVEKLTGVKIPYYALTDFTRFEVLVNALGGVSASVPQQIAVQDPISTKTITVQKGDDQLLNGAQALVLARARKDYSHDQDALRQINVRQLESSIITQVLSNGVIKSAATTSQSENIAKYEASEALVAALEIIEQGVETNMPFSMLMSLAVDFSANLPNLTIYSCTGPYSGENRQSDGLWTVSEDKEGWERIMALADTGENPSSAITQPQF